MGLPANAACWQPSACAKLPLPSRAGNCWLQDIAACWVLGRGGELAQQASA